jgi:hypothetical protein
VIELTYEIRAAFRDQGIGCDLVGCEDCLDNRLVAVLAVVERNLRPASGPDRCSDCGRTARELRPWRETVGGREMVVARLGPTCWRRRMDAAGDRQALPIGGEE